MSAEFEINQSGPWKVWIYVDKGRTNERNRLSRNRVLLFENDTHYNDLHERRVVRN